MYMPAPFAERDLQKLFNFVERHSFGLLVSQVEDEPFASHLPFLLERETGSQGTLIGHMARANPQWQKLGGQTVLAVFTGPHAYISPAWYEAEQVVPTWNYVAVHVYGRAQAIEEPAELLSIVQSTVHFYERTMPNPWSLDGREPFVARLLTSIVGFRVEIEKIEGKWKLNQNHPVERRQKVASALRKRGGESADAIAALMEVSESARAQGLT